MRTIRFVPALLLIPGLILLEAVRGTAPASGQAVPQVNVASVDSIFAEFDGTRTPGCAVGVGDQGQPLLLRAYGMADLEHDVPNTATTIFEPGSVSKQVTAAATILLALDGKLSLSDDVRKYIPELPDYGEVATIRHLLNHTSGLRDWGSVAGIEGWPRTQRVHTHTNVLDILSRQEALNYRPGDFYSYTNSGYNLQAILVGRVAGMPFAEFTKERIFEPLGMTRTSWRDDFTRVVKDRSIAYTRSRQDGQWHMLMPFENVHGNGGLLTTVEDLLKFTRNLETGAVGGPRFIEEMHRQGVLNSGRTISYASGLMIGTYQGVPEVAHSGSTAGYRGHLARFPDQGLAVAVMCNTATANAGGLLHEVADLYLGDALREETPASVPAAIQLPQDRLEALAGGYRDTRTGVLERVTAAEGGLRLGRTLLRPVSTTRFESGSGTALAFETEVFADGRPAAVMDTPSGDGIRLEPVPTFEPSPSDLSAYEGTYRSAEAEATYTVVVEDGGLVLRDRWGEGRALRPLYPDAFSGGGNTLVFHRNDAGRVTGVSFSQSRVWDLRFRKIS